VPGGASLRIDAIELDEAVLDAARAHFGLSSCEVGGNATDETTLRATGAAAGEPGVKCHVSDGADFLRKADDEEYTLLMVDLDMGSLVSEDEKPAAAQAPTQAAAPAATSKDGAESSSRPVSNARRRIPPRADPTRDMYRVLREDGVLVINEYSEELPAKRLETSLRLVRLLKRFFPEVHVLRTNTNHNTMIIAPATATGSATHPPDIESLARRARGCCAHMGRGGIDLEGLVRSLPPNRYQCWC
jgi:hypothetical protein